MDNTHDDARAFHWLDKVALEHVAGQFLATQFVGVRWPFKSRQLPTLMVDGDLWTSL